MHLPPIRLASLDILKLKVGPFVLFRIDLIVIRDLGSTDALSAQTLESKNEANSSSGPTYRPLPLYFP